MKRLKYAVGIAVLAAACGGGAPEGERMPAPGGTPTGGTEIDIRLNSPGEPRTGENTFEVMVTQGSQPITDAEVSLELFMAAMPSMNMPEMRTSVPLTHAGEGRYRGTGNVAMGGAWDANVMVMRGAEHLGARTITIVAK